jgi:hypothetical protein
LESGKMVFAQILCYRAPDEKVAWAKKPIWPVIIWQRGPRRLVVGIMNTWTYIQTHRAGHGMFKSPLKNGDFCKRGFQEVILNPPCPSLEKGGNPDEMPLTKLRNGKGGKKPALARPP